MNADKDQINRTIGRLLAPVVPVMAMYLVWGAVVALMLCVGSWPFGEKSFVYLVPLSVLVYMLTASFITEIYLVHVDDHLTETPYLRTVMMIWTGIVALLVYVLTVKAGLKGNVVSGIGTVNLIVFSCLCATWMTGSLKKPSELVPVCAVVALADMVSVLAGPTRDIAQSIAAYYEKGMEGPPPLTDFILIKIVVPGLHSPMPLFGVSDWIILVFLSSAMVRFGLNDSVAGSGISEIKQRKRMSFYFPVAALGLLAAVLSAQITGFFLPALPIMVIFFLGFSLFRHESMRKLSSKEWGLLIVFSVVMLTLLGSALYLRS